MRIRQCFLTHENNGKQIMVSADTDVFSGIVHSNESAALIVDCLQIDTTKESIVQKLLEHYEVSYEVALADVDKILNILRKINALVE